MTSPSIGPVPTTNCTVAALSDDCRTMTFSAKGVIVTETRQHTMKLTTNTVGGAVFNQDIVVNVVEEAPTISSPALKCGDEKLLSTNGNIGITVYEQTMLPGLWNSYPLEPLWTVM